MQVDQSPGTAITEVFAYCLRLLQNRFQLVKALAQAKTEIGELQAGVNEQGLVSCVHKMSGQTAEHVLKMIPGQFRVAGLQCLLGQIPFDLSRLCRFLGSYCRLVLHSRLPRVIWRKWNDARVLRFFLSP